MMPVLTEVLLMVMLIVFDDGHLKSMAIRYPLYSRGRIVTVALFAVIFGGYWLFRAVVAAADVVVIAVVFVAGNALYGCLLA